MASKQRDQVLADCLPLAEEQALWTAARAGEPAARTRLIETYLPFARIMSAKLYAGRVTDEVEFSEYLQFGSIGLIESVDRFDVSAGVLFRTFAAHRITGAILNGLEHMTEQREQFAVRKKLDAERRDSAKGALADGTRDLFQQLADVAVNLALGFVLDGAAAYDEPAVPQPHYSSAELVQLRTTLHALVARLPERERLVIKYHYLNQVPFHVIADEMGLTRGRISQLHAGALERLRGAAQAMRAADQAW
ncbi:MAG: sigma-70 family RNA polymerase sigma factor [Telluria sp.]